MHLLRQIFLRQIILFSIVLEILAKCHSVIPPLVLFVSIISKPARVINHICVATAQPEVYIGAKSVANQLFFDELQEVDEEIRFR